MITRKYEASGMDVEHKTQRREEVFPLDCQNAFELGARLCLPGGYRVGAGSPLPPGESPFAIHRQYHWRMEILANGDSLSGRGLPALVLPISCSHNL